MGSIAQYSHRTTSRPNPCKSLTESGRALPSSAPRILNRQNVSQMDSPTSQLGTIGGNKWTTCELWWIGDMDMDKWALFEFAQKPAGVLTGQGSMPLILKEYLSYSQLGVLELSSYPYSLKLLWLPIIDSSFFPSIGRRKSWIMPMQLITGSLMLFISINVQKLLNEVCSKQSFFADLAYVVKAGTICMGADLHLHDLCLCLGYSRWLYYSHSLCSCWPLHFIDVAVDGRTWLTYAHEMMADLISLFRLGSDTHFTGISALRFGLPYLWHQLVHAIPADGWWPPGHKKFSLLLPCCHCYAPQL